MKKAVIVIVFFVLGTFLGLGQATLRTAEAVEGFKAIPQEEVYVHFNTSLLFTGEYLYYKLYCIDTSTNNRSTISKIGYVEMVGTDGKTVFKHKVQLENGLGQGDFFLPADVPSGNYKLLGYTQWMTNGEKNHFFHQDISVINPYEENQNSIVVTDSTDIANLPATPVAKPFPSEHLAIELPSKSYGKRGLVAVKLNGLKGEASLGDYSVSVRKVDDIGNVPSKLNAVSYKDLYKGYVPKTNLSGKRIVLPELRGELLSGQVTSNGMPAVNVNVGLTMPGDDYLFLVANTNDEGLFYINLDEEYDQTNAYAQVLHPSPSNFELQFIETPSVKVNTLPFHSFRVTKDQKEAILERSIYNQVENGYFTVKTDSVAPAPSIKPFYGEPTAIYMLDDYTRFPTLRETLVEVVDDAWVKNTGGGNAVFQVRSNDFSSNVNSLPLVLVDGIIIQDHNDLVDYNAKKIKSIAILKDQFFLGSQVFQGIIDMHTEKGDYQNLYYKDYLRTIELFKAQPKKEYFKPVYTLDNEASKRIPDFRAQLLWMPSLKFDSNQENINFYTSDNLGTYEISVQGFTNNGTPVSVKETFVVRE